MFNNIPQSSLIVAQATLAATAAEYARCAHWLSPGELRELAHWRNAERRAAWLAGRWLAKRCLASHGLAKSAPLDAIEILSRNLFENRGHAPVVTVAGRVVDCRLSITHSQTDVAVACTIAPSRRVGIDLVADAPLDEAFMNTWFTPRERRLAAMLGRHQSAWLWAAKEAAFKAARGNGPFTPRTYEVALLPHKGWQCANANGDALQLQIHRLPGHYAVVAHDN